MAPPPNNNEPHREDGPRKDREPRDGFGEQPQAPQAETLLLDRFSQFSTEHALSPLASNFIERAWRAVEPLIRRAIIDDLLEEANSELTFRPIAGAISESGFVTLLVLSNEPRSGHYVVPTVTALAVIDGEAVQPSYTLTDFLSHGVGLLVTLPGLDIGAKTPRLGLDYLLTPTAMQIDQDRFLARAPSSVLGACVQSVIMGRCHRLPEIESIARWRPADGESITYRVREVDGTRHFVKYIPSDSNSPNGITEIETVLPAMPSIQLPRADRFGGKVGLHFEEFHRRRGFTSVDTESITNAYPNLKEVIGDHLKKSFPGFRPEWTIKFDRAVKSDNSTALLVGIFDRSLDSFVPGHTAESSICDKAFSGLLLTMDVTEEKQTPGASKGILGWLGDKFSGLRPRSRQLMRLQIIGPVLSDDAWQEHISRLTSTPETSFFFPTLARAIALDLNRHYDEPTQISISSIKPVRVTPDASNSFDKLVLAIDHSLGTHIVEFVRERSFGLVSSLVPTIQQYFPVNHRHKNRNGDTHDKSQS